jgi:hypothetical protein
MRRNSEGKLTGQRSQPYATLGLARLPGAKTFREFPGCLFKP